MATLPPSPFIIDPDRRFIFDEVAFEAAIAPSAALEQVPLFLRAPSQEYMRAAEIEPILRVINGSRR